MSPRAPRAGRGWSAFSPALHGPYLWVALGAALGGVARYGFSGVVANWIGATFPWGTLVVNVTGCFVIGIVNILTGPDGRLLVAPNARLFMMVGICGGYTTFSSFSLETLNLARNGEWLATGGYIGASVLFCLVGVWLGHTAGALISR
ncbi:MAG TPA: fluoride efflux transporter CrcB [Stellaceae bacterium]|nr:fluoride efflux transporter CrcB [Stellaceae bacterium]